MRKKNYSIGLFIFVFLLISVLSLPLLAQEEPAKKEKSAPNPTEIIAHYAANAKLSDYPPEVINTAKYLILDNIGCILGATQTGVGKKYLRMAKDFGGSGQCTILGSGEKVPWQTASYINGQLANILDFDDTYDFYFPAHPGISIVPVALTFGELLGSSGEDMLLAVIVGYETSMHLGKASGPSHWNMSFLYPFPMGSAIVAAKLLHLDTIQTAAAMRMAGMPTWKFRRLKYDVENNMNIMDTKNEAGVHGYAGILAAFRAQEGFYSRGYFLDDLDFEKWYLAGGSLAGYDMLIAGPGKPYRLLEVNIKPTPSCAFSHPAVTALWAALDHQPVKEKDIEEIVFKGVVRLDHPEWEEMLDAQFSLYCVLSLTALGVEPGPQWYVTNRFDDPEVRALAKKIRLVSDPEAVRLEMEENRNKATVIVKFKDGTSKEATIYNVKGSPNNPLTPGELQAKFQANTRALFKKSRLKKIIDKILNLEKLPNVTELTSLLTSKKLKY